MRLIGSLSAGAVAFLLIGHFTGHLTGLRLPHRARHRLTWRAWLAQAGVDVTPTQFVVVSALMGAAVLFVCTAISGSPIIGMVPATLAATAPYGWFSYHRKARLHAVVAAWPDGILHVLNAMRSGHSVHAAIVDLAKSGPLPLQEAFRYYEAQAQVSNPASALLTVREDLAEPISDKAIAVLVEASRHGTDVALSILGQLASAIREDERTTVQIRAAQREPRLTGWAAFILPWLAVLFGAATSPSFRDFYAGSQGRTVAIIAAVAATGLLALIRRLGREAPEPRVVGGSA